MSVDHIIGWVYTVLVILYVKSVRPCPQNPNHGPCPLCLTVSKHGRVLHEHNVLSPAMFISQTRGWVTSKIVYWRCYRMSVERVQVALTWYPMVMHMHETNQTTLNSKNSLTHTNHNPYVLTCIRNLERCLWWSSVSLLIQKKSQIFTIICVLIAILFIHVCMYVRVCL